MAEEQEPPKRLEKGAVSGRLKALGEDKGRSQTALLADNLGDIEEAIERGVPVPSVWKALQEEGLTLTFKSFENALHRLRRRKAGPPAKKAPKPTTQPSTPTPVVAPSKAQETPEVQTEEDKEFEAFKKAVAHLPIIQRSKKIADFLEKQQENKMSPSTRKWLEHETTKS